MPTCNYRKFWESDPDKWRRCLKSANAGMLAEGWHPKARKFNEVCRKRAVKLWRE